MICPKCGTECWRESCDVEVGVIYGPYGCSACGWSEDPEYDRSEGQPSVKNGRYIDQFGSSYSVDRIVEDCSKFGIPESIIREVFDETT